MRAAPLRSAGTPVALFGVAVLLVAGLALTPDDATFEAGLAADGERLAGASAAVHDRVWARARLVRRVAEGRVGLVEAAAWFRVYNAQGAAEPGWTNPLADLPGDAGEKHCRQVVGWVGASLEGREDSERAEVLARLERELDEARVRGGGKVVLPEW